MNFVYFADRDLGKRFPQKLAAAGLTIERHDELFEPTGSDEEWLEYVGNNGRVAITRDQRIRYRPNERDAVARHRARLLVLIGKTPLPELAENFINTRARIEAFLTATDPPFIAKIYRPSAREAGVRADAPGRVELWYPHRIRR